METPVFSAMNDRINNLLETLAARGPDRDLNRLEAAVWQRIGKRRDVFGGRAVAVQIAATCGALLMGLAIARMAESAIMPQPLSSELIVLSDDSAMAPSVRLEGGI
jgi:hypothetical protein